MEQGIYINDREYYFYNMKGIKYVLVTEPKNIYKGDILEVELIDDDYIAMKLIRFEDTILKSVTYIEQLDSTVIFEYCSHELQNLYANEFEQHNNYLMRYQHLSDGENTLNILKIKFENKSPWSFRELPGHYMFVDKDGDEFKITCRAIGEAKTFVSWVIPSIPRIKKYIKNINEPELSKPQSNGKQKVIEQ